MPLIKCDKCNGTGKLEMVEPISLASLLEPFIEDDRIGFRLKSDAIIPRLPSIEMGEVFRDVVDHLHGVE